MLQKNVVLGFLLLLTACTPLKRTSRPTDVKEAPRSPGLFVGHSQDGEVVVAASHFSAMSGLAVRDVDLGLPARDGKGGPMLCTREMPTGTHVPHWFCRYEDEEDMERQITRDELAAPRLAISSNATAPILVNGLVASPPVRGKPLP